MDNKEQKSSMSAANDAGGTMAAETAGGGMSKGLIAAIAGGIFVVILIVAGVALAATGALSNLFGGASSAPVYDASNPDQLVSQLNDEYQTAISQLQADANPEQAYNELVQQSLAAYDTPQQYTFNIDGEVISEPTEEANPLFGENLTFDVTAEGVIGTLNDALALEGDFSFSIDPGSGFAISQDGNYRLLNEDLYFQLGDGLIASFANLPEGWIKTNISEGLNEETDVTETTPTNEDIVAAITSIDAPLFTNPQQLDSREVEGVTVPCASMEVNRDFIDQYVNALLEAEGTELDSTERQEMEMLLDAISPLTICSSGANSPMLVEMSIEYVDGDNVTEGLESITFNYSAVTSPLDGDFNVEAPPEEEVTDAEELNSGSSLPSTTF